MRAIFLILGYGVPKDIRQDENYNIYLKSVFNLIWGIAAGDKIKKSLIILSGGKTDCFKPYFRTEAGEMLKVFKPLTQKAAVRAKIRAWRLILEKRSLSTLENLLFCRDILKKRKITSGQIYLFCEPTRQKKRKF